ncbi:MAG: hypothetical protein M1840_001342 [Geoglossum simile]|nr:MAG: hypothetical protein M1840_001342 [Geoglossum simile]
MNSFVFPSGYLSIPVYVPAQAPNPPTPPPSYATAVSQPNTLVPGPPGFPANPPPFPGWAPGGPLALPWARPTAPPTPPTAPLLTPLTTVAASGRNDCFPGTYIDGNKAGLPPGIRYLYPREHTTFHLPKCDFDPRSNPGKKFDFWIFRAPTILTVGDLIHQLGAQTGGDDKCGITELLEIGGGCWASGVTVFQKDEQKKQTLAAMGWDGSRGTTRPPLWFKLHKG